MQFLYEEKFYINLLDLSFYSLNMPSLGELIVYGTPEYENIILLITMTINDLTSKFLETN